MSTTNAQVEEFYDNFWKKSRLGKLNTRHRQILHTLVSNGLKRNSTVLEVGCGNGLLTKYIADYVKNGKVYGVDISEITINANNEKYKNVANLYFACNNMEQYKDTNTYDFIIFPDVLEHIPVENHSQLFLNLKGNLHDNSVIFINIPHPKATEWFASNKPELLQIIDQPVYASSIVACANSIGMYLENLESYSIAYDQPEYQRYIFKRNTTRSAMVFDSFIIRGFNNWKWKIKTFLKLL